MSSAEPGGRSRPLRMAGLALLGVAVGALLVGLITLGGGDRDGEGDGGSAGPQSTTADTTADTTAGTTTGQATETPAPTESTPPPAPPTTVAPTTVAPPPQPTPEPTAPVRVYNNSTIRGLAAQAADDFRRNGWQVEEVANYPHGVIPTSTVYFRPGTGEEAAARRLAQRFNLRVEPRFDGIAGAKPGLVVIVTNYYGSK